MWRYSRKISWQKIFLIIWSNISKNIALLKLPNYERGDWGKLLILILKLLKPSVLTLTFNHFQTASIFLIFLRDTYERKRNKHIDKDVPRVMIFICLGSTFLFLAKSLPPHHQGAARRDAETAHVRGVPQQLSMDPRPHRRRIQLLVAPHTLLPPKKNLQKLVKMPEYLSSITSTLTRQAQYQKIIKKENGAGLRHVNPDCITWR